MDSRPGPGTPLTLTTNPKLDAALRRGWEAWEAAAREAGAETVARWMARRLGSLELQAELLDPVRALLACADPDACAEIRLELAELVEGDDLVADTLWEAVLAHAREAGDPDLYAEATARLAAIAETNGDPLAAAEYHLEFLNWRRHPDHAGDPEPVLTSFDEVIRLAELDAAPEAAARYTYRQAAFARLLEADDDRVFAGDWERDPTPYASWA